MNLSRSQQQWSIFPVILLACSSRLAHAATLASSLAVPHCSVSDHSLECRLLGLLKFLYLAAGLLGLALLVVLILAVRTYRRNNAERNPADANEDDKHDDNKKDPL